MAFLPMHKETEQLFSIENGSIAPIAQEIDFATIANPLGCSLRIPELLNSLDEAREETVIRDVSEWLRVPQSSIVLANGSTELINLVPRLFLQPGDRCVVPVPTYFDPLRQLANNGMRIIRIPAPTNNGFEITSSYQQNILDGIHMHNPSLVWLCSPNNPTSAVMPLEVIKNIAMATRGLVIVDEAYQEFVDPENQNSAIRLLGVVNNILVTKTFSKAFGLPQAKVGIGLAHPDIVQRLFEARSSPIAIDRLRLISAALADKDHLLQTAAFIKSESDFVMASVRNMNNIEVAAPPVTGVLLIRHRDLDLHRLLLERGIRGYDYNDQDGLEGLRFVRIGLKDRKGNDRLIQALRSCDNSSSSKNNGDATTIRRVTNNRSLASIRQFMMPEFLSHGGKLRDMSDTDLQQLANNNGQIWATFSEGQIVATSSIQQFESEHGRWFYINNGIAAEHVRHQGGLVMEKLLKEIMRVNRPDAGFVVLSIAHSIFEHLGFLSVDIDQLCIIDGHLGDIVRKKLRPNDPATIYIKLA